MQNCFILSRPQQFLINYVGDRKKEWGIDSPVSDLFTNVLEEIKILENNGFIVVLSDGYALTPLGKSVRCDFRQYEKERQKAKTADVLSAAFQGDYLAAYNVRAMYERESVIAHGISTSFGEQSGGRWSIAHELPAVVKNYILNSKKLDFTDSLNSEHFKAMLRNFYIGDCLDGDNVEIPESFEEDLSEDLNCPALDKQLQEKCNFANPPKLKIYINTKITVFNSLSTRLISEWDGNYMLGMYDCTNPFHAAMAEYEHLQVKNVLGLPKTFQTFWKHKHKNSEKYLAWISSK